MACSRAALPLAGCVTLSLSTSLCLRFLTCVAARTELHVKGLSAGPHKHSAGCKRSRRPALAGLQRQQQTSSVLTADVTSRPSHVSSYFTFLANLRGRYYFSPHFPDRKLKMKEVKTSPRSHSH